MISKLRPPVKTEREVREVYDKLNELIDSVNSPTYRNYPRDYEGKEGDLRTVRYGVDDYRFVAKTGEGWFDLAKGKILTSENIETPEGFSKTLVETKTLQTLPFKFTSSDVPGTISLGLMPGGYMLELVTILKSVVFGGDNKLSISDGTEIMGVNYSRLYNSKADTYGIYKLYTVDTALVATLTGTPSTGEGYVILRITKVIL